MKKLFFTALFLFINQVHAYDAIVIVLEAPLLKEPKINSTVLQTARKGSRVYVPTEIGNLDPLPPFIQTYDRTGNIAYIPTKYIKLVTNDLSENDMPISIPKYDPTDYRLEEPIPTSYPFDDTSFLRANIALTLGNNTKSPYEYGSAFSEQKYSNETGLRLTVAHKVSFDNYDRYYFGLFAAINTTNNHLSFQNSNYAEENRSIIRVGPVLTYDFFKNSKYRLTLGTGFTYNYHKSTLQAFAPDGSHEERLFSGYSLSPFTNTIVQVVDVLPQTDLIAGADFNFYLPHNQTTKDDVSIPELWGGDVSNQIHSGFKPQVAFFLGVQVKY